MNHKERSIQSSTEERYQRGWDAEEKFVLSWRKYDEDAKILRSTKEQDLFDHIDFFVDDISYDVKSLKKISYNHKAVDPTIIWIEFKNVRGKLGWLYGKAERIAFELEKEFIFVEREDLRKRAESLTIKKFTKFPEPYHLYGRTFSPEKERQKGYKCQDVMTYIFLKDIEDLIVERIPKVEIQRKEG